MHVELPGQTLFTFVKTAAAITSAADLRPILRNVLLVATDDGLEILATDLVVSLWLQISVEDGAKVKKPGQAVVLASNLKSILDTIKKEDIVLKADEKRLLVTAGKGKRKSKFQSVVEDPRDFPKLKRFAAKEPFAQIVGKNLNGLVARTKFCAHGERSHFLMHGMLFRAKGGEVLTAATDGRRLGVCKAPLVRQGVTAAVPTPEDGDPPVCTRCESGKAPFVLQQEGVEEGTYCEDCRPADPCESYEAEIVLPANLTPDVGRVIGDPDEVVDIQWMDRGLSVRGSRGEVTIHALNGNFPQFERGIKENTKVVTLDRKQFIDILKQTGVFKSSHTAFVDFVLEDGKMSFRSLVEGAGQTEIHADLEWPHEPLTLVVNPDFLRDSASAMKGDEILFEVEDDRTPTMLREKQSEGVNALYVFSVARR